MPSYDVMRKNNHEIPTMHQLNLGRTALRLLLVLPSSLAMTPLAKADYPLEMKMGARAGIPLSIHKPCHDIEAHQHEHDDDHAHEHKTEHKPLKEKEYEREMCPNQEPRLQLNFGIRQILPTALGESDIQEHRHSLNRLFDFQVAIQISDPENPSEHFTLMPKIQIGKHEKSGQSNEDESSWVGGFGLGIDFHPRPRMSALFSGAGRTDNSFELFTEIGTQIKKSLAKKWNLSLNGSLIIEKHEHGGIQWAFGPGLMLRRRRLAIGAHANVIGNMAHIDAAIAFGWGHSAMH